MGLIDVKGIKASFRETAQQIGVAMNIAPDFKLYDPKTKTLYEIDRNGGHPKVTRSIENPTAEESRDSQNINTFRRNLGTTLNEYASDFNDGLNHIGTSTGLNKIEYSSKPPTGTDALTHAYKNVMAGFQQQKGEYFGNLCDQLHDMNGADSYYFKKNFAAEQSMDEMGVKIDMLKAVDAAAIFNARPLITSSPTIALK